MEIKTNIIPCKDGCPDCVKDIERYEELLNELSSMHLELSKNPATLCSTSFKEFKREYWQKVPKAQSDLFEIANKHKLSWAQ